MALHVLASASSFFALLFFSVWALEAVNRPVDARVRALAPDRNHRSQLASIPFQQRVFAPAIDAIGRHVASLLPAALVRRTERRLVLAGRPMRPAAFFALMIGLAALFGATYLTMIVAAASGTPAPAALFPAAAFGLLGAMLPVFWLSSHARARQRAMLRNLPDSLDLLTICVEGGLGLEGAFREVVDKQSGPFIEEVRQMLQEIGVGKARRQALLDLAERTDLDDLRSLVSALIQADQLGTSMSQVLRVQSQRLRVRRRQRAEQEARRAPVRMVFPLVFCLMPSLFIFILGPIIVRALEYLSS